MPNQVCMGAMMRCSFGMAPSSLVVLPVVLRLLPGWSAKQERIPGAVSRSPAA